MAPRAPDAPLPAGRYDKEGQPLCRWCGRAMLEKGRRWWHSECAEEYLRPYAEDLGCDVKTAGQHLARVRAYRKKLF